MKGHKTKSSRSAVTIHSHRTSNQNQVWIVFTTDLHTCPTARCTAHKHWPVRFHQHRSRSWPAKGAMWKYRILDLLKHFIKTLYKMHKNFYWFMQAKYFSAGEKSGKAPLQCTDAAPHICIWHKPRSPTKGKVGSGNTSQIYAYRSGVYRTISNWTVPLSGHKA